MKVSEMNAHQNALYRIMGELTSQLIGCYENSMMDDEKDAEEYKETTQKILIFGNLTARLSKLTVKQQAEGE